MMHLLCHAHLDPLWLWTFEDGASEALSTFRVAADFCEHHDGFVFNQNEALLYAWVETNDPELFSRVRRLVAEGRWHVAGGAYLQPDLNAPSAESVIRQFLYGLSYFRSRFGVHPTVAYNLDTFGHPAGLPSLLAGCGFSGYLFCRPDHGTHELPRGEFVWSDRSGASVVARRVDEGYVTHIGALEHGIEAKLKRVLESSEDAEDVLMLWGVGDHGGGPSRREYESIRAFFAAQPGLAFRHTTPEAYFAKRLETRPRLPAIKGGLQRSFPGCYGSMARLKSRHRAVEGELLRLERFAALLWWSGVSSYPESAIHAAWDDLLLCQFHDVITGTGTPAVEAEAFDRLGRASLACRESLLGLWMSSLVGGEANESPTTPIFVFNPHGHRLRTLVPLDVTVAHAWQENRSVVIQHRGQRLRSQRVASPNNLNTLWTPRVLVAADLRPFEVQRWDLELVEAQEPKSRPPRTRRGPMRIDPRREVLLSPRTGRVSLSHAEGSGRPTHVRGGFRPVVFDDLDHSWSGGDAADFASDPSADRHRHAGFVGIPWTKPANHFRLATREETAALAPRAVDRVGGHRAAESPPFRVVEDGPLRHVTEAVMTCGGSWLLRRYEHDRVHGRLFIEDRVSVQMTDRWLMHELPLGFVAERCVAESYGDVTEETPIRQIDLRSQQRWCAAVSNDGRYVGVINDGSFAYAHTRRKLYLSLLRTPPYASFGIKADDPYHAHAARPRQSQGEHVFRFEVRWGDRFDECEMRRCADEMQFGVATQPLYGRAGASVKQELPRLAVRPASVRIVAIKRAEDGDALMIRVHNTGKRKVGCTIELRGAVVFNEPIDAFAFGTVRLERLGTKTQEIKARWTNLVEDL